MPSIALSDSPDASPQALAVLGVLCVLFALGNLGLRTWAQRRLQAGKTLPGPFRTLRVFVEYPKLFLAGMVLEVAIGAVFMTAAIVMAVR